MIYLEGEDLLILQSILKKYPYKFYAYGSRVKGNYKKFSDLDLCLIEKITDEELLDLHHNLKESDLSINIDIKRWFYDMDKNFRSLIEADLVLFPTN